MRDKRNILNYSSSVDAAIGKKKIADEKVLIEIFVLCLVPL